VYTFDSDTKSSLTSTAFVGFTKCSSNVACLHCSIQRLILLGMVSTDELLYAGIP
jgi:hypothetical protein